MSRSKRQRAAAGAAADSGSENATSGSAQADELQDDTEPVGRDGLTPLDPGTEPGPTLDEFVREQLGLDAAQKQTATAPQTTDGPVGDPDSDEFPAELGSEEARRSYPDGTIVVVSVEGGKYAKAPGEGWLRR